MIKKMLILVLSLFILFGCGEKDKSNGKDKSNVKVNTYPPYEVNIFHPGPNIQSDANIVSKKASEYFKDINTTIKINCVPWYDWLEKKRMITNSGEKADLVFTANWSEFTNEVSKGYWKDLSTLLNKYGSKLKGVLSEELLKAGVINNKQYAIPVNKEFAEVVGLLFNKSLIEKYNIDYKSIKSLNDLEKYLQLIKEKEIGIVPLLLTGDITPGAIVLRNKYEIIGAYNSVGVVKRDGGDLKVLNQYEQSDIREAYRLTNKWNQLGYVNKYSSEVQSRQSEMRRKGDYFCYLISLKPGKDKEMIQQYGVDLVQHYWDRPYADSLTGSGAMMSIPKECENPERAMMVLERMYTNKDLINILVNGIEGIHYKKISDNIIDFPEGINSTNSKYLPQNNWQIGNQYLNYIWKIEEPDKFDKFRKFTDEAIKSKLLGFTYSTTEVKIQEAKLMEEIYKFDNQLENGLINYEKYDEILNKINSLKVDEVIKEKQRQIDNWIKK